MTTEEWVKSLNALSLEMDEIANMVHPTVWADHGIPELMAEYRELATTSTIDEVQLSLWEAE